MKKIRTIVSWFLILTLFFDGFAIELSRAWAQEKETSPLQMKTDDIDPSRFEKPMRLLRDRLLSQIGLTRNQVYHRAWANWALLLSQALVFFGRESQELISLERMVSPENIKGILDRKEIITCAPKFLKLGEVSLGAIGKILPSTVREIDDGFEAFNWAMGLQKTLGKYGKSVKEGIEGNKILGGLEAFAYPSEHTGLNGEKVVHAFTKSEGSGLPAKAAPVMGAFRVGIGVLSAVMALKEGGELLQSYQYQTNFENIVNGTGIVLDLLMLAGFLLPPPLGEIVGAIQITLLIAKELISAYKEWLDTKELAYQDSYRFLLDADPEFKSFCDNSAAWPDTIKSEGLKMLEEKYKGKDSVELSGPEGDVPFKRGLETAMNQGKVMTYYNRGFPSPIGTNLEILKKVWEDKMDYMKWKPTQKDLDEEKDEKKAPVWQKVLVGAWHTTPIYWAYKGVKTGAVAIGNAWNSDNIKRNKIPIVWYNPDFYLYHQIRKYSDPKNPGVVKLIKYRFETAPYHMIPLVEIPVDRWGTIDDNGPILSALVCDRYLSCMKSLKALEILIKGITKAIREKSENLREKVSSIREDVIETVYKPNIEALIKLGNAYKSDPGKPVNDDVWDKLQTAFDCDPVPGGQEKTPENIIKENRLLIQNYLNVYPYALGKYQAEAILSGDSVVSFFLLYKLFQSFAVGVKKEAEAMEKAITDKGFKKFIEEKEYLHFKEGFFVSMPNIPKKKMEELVKSLTEEDGDAMSGFREAVDLLVKSDDHPGMITRDGDKPFRRYLGALGSVQGQALTAAKLWKNLESKTRVKIKIPCEGKVGSNPNDETHKWIDSQDPDTLDLFCPDISDRLFQLPGAPFPLKNGENAALAAVYRACMLDQTPPDFFEKLPSD